MGLLELPLDLLRYVMLTVAHDFELRELLRLRLINRIMDREVMHAMEGVALFEWRPSSPRYSSLRPPYPSRKERLPLPSSYLDFVSSFIYVRPHLQSPWNVNISSFLNHVVDELLRGDGLDLEHPSRKGLVLSLCHEIGKIQQWQQNPGWFNVHMFPTSDFSSQTGSLEFNVFLARALLGKTESLMELAPVRRKSCVFGTPLDVCVKTGQTGLVTSILSEGVDMNDTFHSTLEMAIASENSKMLDTLLSPRYGTPLRGSRLEKCIMQAIECDRTEAALRLLHPDNWPAIEARAKDAFREACYHGNLAVVEALADDLHVVNPCLQAHSYALVQFVAFYGHQHILDYLFQQDVWRDPLAMRAAACAGNIAMARFLRAYGMELDAETWCSVLRVATEHATAKHLAFTRSIIDEAFVSPRTLAKGNGKLRDLFIYACMYGNVFLVKVLGATGMNLDYTDGYETTPPILAAMAAGQTAVVEALLAMGARPIDPATTEMADQFKCGNFPKPWPPREINVGRITSWWVN